jgi:hypothetical protein
MHVQFLLLLRSEIRASHLYGHRFDSDSRLFSICFIFYMIDNVFLKEKNRTLKSQEKAFLKVIDLLGLPIMNKLDLGRINQGKEPSLDLEKKGKELERKGTVFLFRKWNRLSISIYIIYIQYKYIHNTNIYNTIETKGLDIDTNHLIIRTILQPFPFIHLAPFSFRFMKFQ